MKQFIFAVLFVMPLSLQLNASPTTRDVAVSIHDVFIPEKIEGGSDAKIIVMGMFPNTCYRWDRAEIRDVSATEHVVQGHAILTETMCLMVLVPFNKEVNLGKLQSGSHTLRFLNGDQTYFERTLVVQ